MLSAVEFQDQACFSANEIDEVRTDPVLSAKFVTFKPAVAQVSPEPGFGIGLRSAQIAFT